MSDEELEAIRKKKLLELQQQLSDENKKDTEKEAFEKQKNELLRKILTPEARSRLTNIKMVKPELAESLEIQLINLAQTGQLARAGLSLPITDEQLKLILKKVQPKRREINIRFK